MRIAFVYDASYPDTKGGVEHRVWELARRLRAAGNHVELLVPKMWDGPDVISREDVVLRGVCPGGRLYKASGRRAVIPSLRHAVGVYRALRELEFDVVDCQVPAHLSCLSARLALRSSRTKQTVTWHEAWGRHWREEFGVLGYVGRAIERTVGRLPVGHIGVSDHLAVAMRDLGIEPMAVVEAGVDVASIEQITADNQADIVFVGRLVPTKNLGLVLESMKILHDSGRKVTLRVVGDGPMRDAWQDQTTSLGLSEAVEFLGSVPEWEDVIRVMKGAKVLALPSVREGFGLVALEAAACGVPVVTVDHPRNAAREVVRSSGGGLVVSPTAGDFAAALAELLSDDGLRSLFSERGTLFARQTTWLMATEHTRTVFDQVAA